jgi:uncharacterized delta-60 repeat protein
MRRGVDRVHTSRFRHAVLASSAVLVLAAAGAAMAGPAPSPWGPSVTASPTASPTAGPTAAPHAVPGGSWGTIRATLGDGGDARARALVRQSDGKLVAVGYARDHGKYVIALSRFTTGGDLDMSFGHNGIVLTPVGSGKAAQGNAAVLQPDGRIVVAGSASDGGQQKFALARYNTDGKLDTGFGTGGLVMTAIGGDNTTSEGVANALVLQPDGDLVAVGTATVTVMVGPSESEQAVVALARYTSGGVLDDGFGTHGIAATAVGAQGAAIATANAAVLQSDGGIVVGGNAFEESSNYAPGTYLTVLRYTSAGALDGTFGSAATSSASGSNAASGGTQTGAFIGHAGTSGGTSSIYGLTIDSNGNVVAAGYAQDHGQYKFVVLRLTGAGVADTTFGAGGYVLTDVGDGGSGSANAIATSADDELIAAGTALDGARHKVGMLRLTSAGTVDNGFGNRGTTIIEFGASAGATALLVQPDGSLVTAGFDLSGARYDFLLTRTVPAAGGGKLDTGKLLTSLREPVGR